MANQNHPALPPELEGKVFHAAAESSLQILRPVYAYVPNSLIQPDKTIDLATYQNQRWDTINAGANSRTVGSHVFPDLTKPADVTSLEVEQFLNELNRLRHKAGKIAPIPN